MKMMNNRRRMVAVLLGTMLVAGAAHSQSIGTAYKNTGVLDVTVSDGTTCTITPSITKANLTGGAKSWIPFATVEFGCENSGAPVNATIGIPDSTDVIKQDTRAGLPNQYVLKKNSSGDAVPDLSYYFQLVKGTNTSVQAAVAEDTAAHFMTGYVGTTDTAARGTVTLSGYYGSGAAAQAFNIPLMVKAWN